MHSLEYALFAISILLEKSTEKREDLAKELKALATISHNYKEPKEDLDLGKEWMADLHKRADDYIFHRKESAN